MKTRSIRRAVIAVCGCIAAGILAIVIAKVYQRSPRWSTFSSERAAGGNVTFSGAPTQGKLEHVVFAPNGRQIASAFNNYYLEPRGVVRVTDAASGKTVLTLTDRGSTLSSIAWSPDGAFVAAAGANWVDLWDAQNGKALRRFKYLGADRLAFSSDSDLIAVSSSSIYSPDSLACIWNSDGTLLRTIGRKSRGSTGSSALSFSPQGLLATSGDEGVLLWNARDGRLVRRIDSNQAGLLAFSPDGRYLAASFYNVDPAQGRAIVWVWDVPSGRRLTPAMPQSEGGPSGLSWTHDGKFLVAGGANDVRVWDWRGARLAFQSFDAKPKANNSVQSMAFAPETKQFVFVRDGRLTTLKMSDLAAVCPGASREVVADAVLPQMPALQARQKLKIAEGDLHGRQAGDGVSCVAFSPDGRLIVGSGRTGHGGSAAVLLVWDTQTKRLIRRWTGAWRTNDRLLVSSSDVIAGQWDGGGDASPITLHDLKTGAVLAQIKAREGNFYSMAFSQDGKTLFTASGVSGRNRGAVAAWDARSGALKNWWPVDDAAVTWLVPTRNGRDFVLAKTFTLDAQGNFNRTELWLWNSQTASFARQLFRGPDNEPLIGFDLSPDESQVAAVGIVQGSPDPSGSLRCFIDLKSAKVTRKVQKGFRGIALRVQYAGDGNQVVVRPMSIGKSVEAWDGRTGRLIKTTQTGAAGNTITVSPDRQTLALTGKPLVQLRHMSNFLP